MDNRKTMNVVLWVVQILLAAAFLMTGFMKLTMAEELLAASSPFPVLFVRFISVCEILGAIGLVVPGLTRIRTGLTPLAAAGLVMIMIGAVVSTVMTLGLAMAVMPLILGILAAFVAYGRWQAAPLEDRERSGAI